jgi:uncharacterized Zn-binding protein involved in type VI secretion
MAAATRQGDYCTGHDGCAPVPLIESSSNVFINGRGVGRVGDKYASHGCVTHSIHTDSISSGSSTVFINGVSAARVGDTVLMAGTIQNGSNNVFIGD